MAHLGLPLEIWREIWYHQNNDMWDITSTKIWLLSGLPVPKSIVHHQKKIKWYRLYGRFRESDPEAFIDFFLLEGDIRAVPSDVLLSRRHPDSPRYYTVEHMKIEIETINDIRRGHPQKIFDLAQLSRSQRENIFLDLSDRDVYFGMGDRGGYVMIIHAK